MMEPQPMKVAIVHDYLTQSGGAERVVEAFHEIWPDAPIFTSVYDADHTFKSFRQMDVRSSNRDLAYLTLAFPLYQPIKWCLDNF